MRLFYWVFIFSHQWNLHAQVTNLLTILCLNFTASLEKSSMCMQYNNIFLGCFGLIFYEHTAHVIYTTHFYPTALNGCRGIVFTHGVRMVGRAGGRMGGRREIVCPGCISETVRCRKLILGRDIG